MRPLKRQDPAVLRPTYSIPPEVTITNATIRSLLSECEVYPVDEDLNEYEVEPLIDYMQTQTWARDGIGTWKNYRPPVGEAIEKTTDYIRADEEVSYRRARGALITNFGEQCAYCEMMVHDFHLE